MIKCFKGFYLSLGMFTAIPLPSYLWGGAAMSLALVCLPLAGVIIGGIWWGAACMLLLGAVHTVLAAAVLTLVPFLATGFLHLDGYMDTSDALLSRRPYEEKLRILKDPHTGAFAVIMLACLILLQFGAMYAITEKGELLLLLIIIAAASRCCGAFSVLSLKTMEGSGYANAFKENTGFAHKFFIAALTISAAALSYLWAGIPGIIVFAAVIAGYFLATAYVYKEFRGVSGDLTGFAIVTSELCGLIALAVI